MKKILAWSVHLFTASGLVAGFMGLLAAVAGDYRACMAWMFLTLVIDGIDGTFARLAKVEQVLPQVSGKTIDYVIDFFTYAILPAYLFYVALPLAPTAKMIGVSAILLSSAIYYGIEKMVSEDGQHFIGFPVLWNMVLYVYIFLWQDAAPAAYLIATIVIATFHFVPIRVPYPSRGGRWFGLTLVAILLFLGSALANVYIYPERSLSSRIMAWLSIAYFVLLTLLDTWSAIRKTGNHQ